MTMENSPRGGGLSKSSPPSSASLEQIPHSTPQKKSSSRLKALGKAISAVDPLISDDSDSKGTKIVFHSTCMGDFWGGIIGKLRTKSEFNFSHENVVKSTDDGFSRFIYVFGFDSRNPSREQIDDVARQIRHAKRRLNIRLRVICVIPRNGELQSELRRSGADEVINTSDPEQQSGIPDQLTTRISLLEENFDASSCLLQEPIICKPKNHGSEGPEWSLESAVEGMALFAVQEVKTRGGSRRISRYREHMRDHEQARDLVRRHLFESPLMRFRASRILEVGFGEGHPGRHLARLAVSQIRDHSRDYCYIIGIDRDRDMFDFANKGLTDLRRQNARDAKKLGIKEEIPDLVDMKYRLGDFFDIDMGVLEDLAFGKFNMKFGRPDCLLMEYMAHWTKDRVALVQRIDDVLAEDGVVAIQEELPLKITPTRGMTKQVADAIVRGTYPMASFDEYLDIFRSRGFVPLFEAPDVCQIDPLGTPPELVHKTFGTVLQKRGPHSRIFQIGPNGLSITPDAPRVKEENPDGSMPDNEQGK